MKQGQQDIEQRNHRSQTCLNTWFQAVKHPFEMTNDGEQGKRSLHAHAVIPCPFGAQLAVFWHTVFPAKPIVSQDDAVSIELLNERMERVIRDIHRIPIPVDHVPKAIEYLAQLDANAPPSLVFGLFAHLLPTPTFSNGKEQLNRIAINDRKSSGRPETARSNPDG